MEAQRGGPAGPFDDLEVIRQSAGMPTSRWCAKFGIPERTWRRWQARARTGATADGSAKGPWPAPVRRDAEVVAAVRALAAAHPGWGHRRVRASVRERGIEVSEASVLRILRELGGPAGT